MKTIYLTLTGTKYYYGTSFLEKDMMVTLKKEPQNQVDAEAIQVQLKGMGTIGYIANSPYTVMGESFSAGRIYDKIGKTAIAQIVIVTPSAALLKLISKKGKKKKRND